MGGPGRGGLEAGVEREAEAASGARVESLGYELVELERAGSKTRPILRVRIDVPGGTSEPGQGVTVDDCTRVSRELETYLDDSGGVSERYVLEVSSPGVERPLTRRRDFERFSGREVALSGKAPLAGRGRRLEGKLVGVSGEGDAERIRLRLPGGEEVEVPRGEVTRAHLVFRWEKQARSRKGGAGSSHSQEGL
jgi:ribosome maturation factor RimP